MATEQEQRKFIEDFKELSFSAANQLHIYAYIPLAQWALETGWGTGYNPSTRNLGGIMQGNAVASFGSYSDFIRIYVESMFRDCPHLYHHEATPASSVQFILEGTAYNTVNPSYATEIADILKDIERLLTPADKPWVHANEPAPAPKPAPKPEPVPVPTPTPSHEPKRVDLVTIKGDVLNDGFYFTVEGVAAHMHLDTGAYEMLISKTIADAHNCPNLGAANVSGIGGTESMYNSKIDVTIGTRVYRDVPCVVDPSYNFYDDGLFGLRFLVDNKINLDLDLVNNEVTFYTYE